MAILRDRRDELNQIIQNKTNNPVQNTSGDHDKVEAAEKSLADSRTSFVSLARSPTCMTEQVNLRALMAENFA